MYFEASEWIRSIYFKLDAIFLLLQVFESINIEFQHLPIGDGENFYWLIRHENHKYTKKTVLKLCFDVF